MAWLTLLGGLALFTYGFDLTARGLRRAAARRLKRLLGPVARNRLTAVLFGFLLTLLTGSSTATTTMVVGLVAAGALALSQALAVMLGAAVGTTLVVQIIATPLVLELAPALVLLGVLWRLVERGRVIRGPGEAVLGFGLTLYGLGVMLQTAQLLTTEPAFRQAFTALAHAAPLIFLAATVFTLLVANSATAIALGFSFAHHGLLPATAQVAIVLGANLGGAAAAFVQSLFQAPLARRASLGYLLTKGVLVLVLLPLSPYLAAALPRLSPEAARAMAHLHSLLNLALLLLFAPLTPWLSRQILALWPVTEPARRLVPELWLPPGPAAEAIRLAQQALYTLARRLDQEMFQPIPGLFARPTESVLQAIRRAERETDQVFRRLQGYLAEIGGELYQEKTRLLYQASELEHLGDALVRLSNLALKLYNLDESANPAARLSQLMDLVEATYRESLAGLGGDSEAAKAAVRNWPELARSEEELRYGLLAAAGPADVTAALLEAADGLLDIGRRTVALARLSLGIF